MKIINDCIFFQENWSFCMHDEVEFFLISMERFASHLSTPNAVGHHCLPGSCYLIEAEAESEGETEEYNSGISTKDQCESYDSVISNSSFFVCCFLINDRLILQHIWTRCHYNDTDVLQFATCRMEVSGHSACDYDYEISVGGTFTNVEDCLTYEAVSFCFFLLVFEPLT